MGSRANWHASVPEALASCGGTALILSNELVDAFPCRVFEKRPDGWRELALRIDGGRITEEWIVRPLPDSTAFLHPWPDGQRVEVQESFQLWRRGWLPALVAGSMLTIDYGDTCPALYFRRPGGTLRAYAHHQRLEGRDVYGGFGLRDLTADVNFSDLQTESAFSSAMLTTVAELECKYDPSPAKNRSEEILHSRRRRRRGLQGACSNALIFSQPQASQGFPRLVRPRHADDAIGRMPGDFNAQNARSFRKTIYIRTVQDNADYEYYSRRLFHRAAY